MVTFAVYTFSFISGLAVVLGACSTTSDTCRFVVTLFVKMTYLLAFCTLYLSFVYVLSNGQYFVVIWYFWVYEVVLGYVVNGFEQ